MVDITVGDDSDRPHDLSEYTVLPIYPGANNDEPSSIIIWGGYGERKLETDEEFKARYGDEHNEFTQPYRSRLLRFDVATHVWKKLKPTAQVLPKAQSLAAVDTCENEIIHLLIIGGYGFNPGECMQ